MNSLASAWACPVDNEWWWNLHSLLWISFSLYPLSLPWDRGIQIWTCTENQSSLGGQDILLPCKWGVQHQKFLSLTYTSPYWRAHTVTIRSHLGRLYKVLTILSHSEVVYCSPKPTSIFWFLHQRAVMDVNWIKLENFATWQQSKVVVMYNTAAPVQKWWTCAYL